MELTIFGDHYVPHTQGVIEIPFLTGLIIFTVIWFAVRALICFFRKKFDMKHEAKMLLMYINLAVIFRFTFFPLGDFEFHTDPLRIDTAEIFTPWVNLIPFVKMFDFVQTRNMIINITGNILMFVPTGILLPVIYKKLRSFPRVLLAGGLISLCIEILQLPCVDRASDIDDLILNTVGAALGYGIYTFARKIKKKA